MARFSLFGASEGMHCGISDPRGKVFHARRGTGHGEGPACWLAMSVHLSPGRSQEL